MSHAAVFMTCQIPLKSGLRSGVRGSGLGVCALATETAARKRNTRRGVMAEVYRRGSGAGTTGSLSLELRGWTLRAFSSQFLFLSPAFSDAGSTYRLVSSK